MPLHHSSGRWRLGLTLSLLTVFLWGILPIALTVMLQALDIYTIAWFRFLFSFGLLAVYLAVRQQLPKPQKLRSTTLGLLAIATIFLAINYLLFQQGLVQTSPSNAEVLIEVAPVLMGLGALAIFKERYTRRQWAGFSVLSLGFAIYFHEQLQNLITAPIKYLVGSGLIVLGAIVWAVYALAQKQLLQQLPSSNIMLIVYGGCMLFLSPFATPQAILTLSPLYLGTLLFCALNTLIAYGAFAEALEHWEASRVSAVVALSPIVTLVSMWAMSFLAPTLIAPEHITGLGLTGAALVVSGSIAIALGKTHD